MRKSLEKVNIGDVVWILPKNKSDSIEVWFAGIDINTPLKVVNVNKIENSLIVQLEGIDRYLRVGRLTNVPP